MDDILLVARLILAAVFLVAALTKLADRAGTRQAIADFGVPAFLAPPLATLLPLLELAAALALLPLASAWWGAIAILALLAVFTAAILVNLARGRKPNCHCFGQISSAPVGWRTVARNVILAALAALVGAPGPGDQGSSIVVRVGDLTTPQLAALIAGVIAVGLVAAGGSLLFKLLTQYGRLLVRVEELERRLSGTATPETAGAAPERPPGLPVGTPAPVFALAGLYGETLTLDALRAAGNNVLLVFADPGCGPCTALMPKIAHWQREHRGSLTTAVISHGSAEANRAHAAEHGLVNILIQADSEVTDAYKVDGTPSAVIVTPEGTIGSPVVAGPEAVEELARRTVEPVSNGSATPAPSSATHAPTTTGTFVPANTPGHVVQEAHIHPHPHTHSHGPVPTQVGCPQGNGTPLQPVPIGEPAPTVKLLDLDGKTMNLAGFRGSKTAVLFWDPACGFCIQMLESLRAWEENRPPGAPRLLVVAKGTAQANRTMGFRSPVVLDPDFETARAFGTQGTPSALLVDEEGKIASGIAGGAPAVLELLGAPQPVDSSSTT